MGSKKRNIIYYNIQFLSFKIKVLLNKKEYYQNLNKEILTKHCIRMLKRY
jgi:hypothetical protein